MSENNIQEQQTENKEPVQEPVAQEPARAEGLVESTTPIVSKSKTYVKKGGSARGRPANPDKKTAYGLPVDEEYFKKYYQEKLSVKIMCEQCKLYVTKGNFKKHQSSSYHLRFCTEIKNDDLKKNE
jgi:hypothetical protein